MKRKKQIRIKTREPKNVVLAFKVTEVERGTIISSATKAGKNLSEYIRSKALGRYERELLK